MYPDQSLKLSVLTLMATLSTAITCTTALAGAGSSGGGDPKPIAADSYPDPSGLANALAVAQSAIQQSPYPQSLKDQLRDELTSLQSDNKYRILPSLIILGPGAGPEGYSLPKDAYQFIDLGGMTENGIGAPVYLSERVTHYSVQDFAKILIHEGIHHIASPGLASDESFVKALTDSIFTESSVPALQTAVENHTYFTTTEISPEQFIDGLGLDGIVERMVIRLGDRVSSTPQVAVQQFRKRALEILNQNLANFNINWILDSTLFIIDQDEWQKAFRPLKGDVWYSSDASNDAVQELENSFFALAQRLNPGNPVKEKGWMYECKDKSNPLKYFFKICDDPVLMKDLFVPAN